MSPQIGSSEIFLRLALTITAGALIGLDRGERGHAAGLRTTLLVCLAASFSMIQVNILLDMSGKTPSSFAVMDLMRLPLGILTGVGFIGAGSILKKGELIKGITTAATLWYVTVLGLLFGGGQLLLGIVGTLLGCTILGALRLFERRWHRNSCGQLMLLCDETGPDCPEVTRQIRDLGAEVTRWLRLDQSSKNGVRKQVCEVTWKTCPDETGPPPFVEKFLETKGVLRVNWTR
jgi:putative Mg2+ transporter-C (MgtC) family protein